MLRVQRRTLAALFQPANPLDYHLAQPSQHPPLSAGPIARFSQQLRFTHGCKPLRSSRSAGVQVSLGTWVQV